MYTIFYSEQKHIDWFYELYIKLYFGVLKTKLAE